MDRSYAKIKVTANGPYEVSNVQDIRLYAIKPDEAGASEEYVPGQKFTGDETPLHLCRCGRSGHAPFCDGSHEKADWDGEETASFEPILNGAEAIEGPNLTLADNQDYCAYARFCDAKGRIWNLVQEGTPAADKQAVKEACNCPSGRLIMFDNRTGKPIEPELQPEIGVLEDPAMGCSGPLWVKGGIQVESESGKLYERRNRQTLCRCGHSRNKPFCDGSHAAVKYQDSVFRADGAE